MEKTGQHDEWQSRGWRIAKVYRGRITAFGFKANPLLINRFGGSIVRWVMKSCLRMGNTPSLELSG